MPAKTVRRLIDTARVATLATVDAATAHPYASLVEVAALSDGRPVLLLSDLARHSRNLVADPRVSLLIDRRSNDNPLTSERATLLGRLVLSDDPSVARRYLVWHPQAAGWSGFADFNFWVMDVTSAHLIAGFGRIVEVAGAELLGTVDNIASGDA